MRKWLWPILLVCVCGMTFYAVRNLHALTDENAPKEMEVIEESEALSPEKGVEESSWWIGISVGAVPEAVAAQIPEAKLAAGKGLFISSLVPDSPAAKAELKPFDIITKVGEKAVSMPEELVEAVRGSEGKALALEILRAGETKTIEVTPTEIPEEVKQMRRLRQGFHGFGFPGFAPGAPFQMEEGMPGFSMEFPEGAEIPAELKEMMKRMEELRGGGMKIQIPQGVIPENGDMNIESHASASVVRSMQANIDGKPLAISVKQTDDEPAEVKVQWEGKTYETTADKLDVIPEEIREKVAQFAEGGKVIFHSSNEAAENDEDADETDEIKVDSRKVIDLK
ncbi:MAG: PDZ domain-containing protein [Planctomycetia bacterium]|nr:PDZ domain-containing protein [Planctomycetia bacterium]